MLDEVILPCLILDEDDEDDEDGFDTLTSFRKRAVLCPELN